MNKTDLRRYRERLENLSRRLGGDLDQISDEALRQGDGEASGSLSNLPLHTADLGTDHANREVALALLENEGQLLNQIRTALARADRGTFGQCEECGRAIPKARLDAIPYTPLCVECASRLEAGD